MIDPHARIAQLEAALRETKREINDYLADSNGTLALEMAVEAIDAALASAPAPDTTAGAVTACATEDCRRHATIHFVSGDVGSDYCPDCFGKIMGLRSPDNTGSGVTAGAVQEAARVLLGEWEAGTLSDDVARLFSLGSTKAALRALAGETE